MEEQLFNLFVFSVGVKKEAEVQREAARRARRR